MLLYKQWVKKEIKEEIKKYLRQMKMETHHKSNSKRKVCSDIGLPQERRNISGKQSNITLKGSRERRTGPKLGERGK